MNIVNGISSTIVKCILLFFTMLCCQISEIYSAAQAQALNITEYAFNKAQAIDQKSSTCTKKCLCNDCQNLLPNHHGHHPYTQEEKAIASAFCTFPLPQPLVKIVLDYYCENTWLDMPNDIAKPYRKIGSFDTYDYILKLQYPANHPTIPYVYMNIDISPFTIERPIINKHVPFSWADAKLFAQFLHSRYSDHEKNNKFENFQLGAFLMTSLSQQYQVLAYKKFHPEVRLPHIIIKRQCLLNHSKRIQTLIKQQQDEALYRQRTASEHLIQYFAKKTPKLNIPTKKIEALHLRARSAEDFATKI